MSQVEVTKGSEVTWIGWTESGSGRGAEMGGHGERRLPRRGRGQNGCGSGVTSDKGRTRKGRRDVGRKGG